MLKGMIKYGIWGGVVSASIYGIGHIDGKSKLAKEIQGIIKEGLEGK